MPTGVAAGDQLLAFCNGDASGSAFTISGWTLIDTADLSGPDGESIRLLTRVATGSEGSTQSVSFAGTLSSGWGVIIAAWSGRAAAALTSANLVHTLNTSSNSSPISTSSTGLNAQGSDDLGFFMGLDITTATISAGSWTQATGFTNQNQDLPNTRGYGNNFQYQDNVSAGATGSIASTVTLTGTGNAGWAGILIRIPKAFPIINTQPFNANIPLGGVAVFTVSATASSGSLTYQWQDNRSGSFANCTDGSGATSATYTSPPLDITASLRLYQCLVTDSNGTTTTLPAQVVFVFNPDLSQRLQRTKNKSARGLAWDLTSAEWW